MSAIEFFPSHTTDSEARLRHLERWATIFSGRNATDVPPSSAQGTSIDESDVTFEPASGHTHDGVNSRLITLLGDVTGTNDATLVEKIRGTPIPAPVAGDDLKFIQYVNGSVAFAYSFVTLAGDVTGPNNASVVERLRGKNLPAPVAGNDQQAIYYNHGGPAFAYANFSALAMLGAWTQPLLTSLTGSDAEIDNSAAASPGTQVANVMPKAGALAALSVKLTGDVGGVGDDATFTVYKNGVATTITGTITGGAGTEDEFTNTFTPVAFAAGDDLTVQAKTAGSPAAVRAVALVWGFFTP